MFDWIARKILPDFTRVIPKFEASSEDRYRVIHWPDGSISFWTIYGHWVRVRPMSLSDMHGIIGFYMEP